MINQSLALEKINYLKESSTLLPHNYLNFNFHSIPIKFHSNNDKFLIELKEYLPSEWLIDDSKDYNIDCKSVYHFDLRNWKHNIDFDDEVSSLTHQIEGHTIQRDFVAIKNEGATLCSFDAKLDDGAHNFFRWFLSPLLIQKNKLMIHSSAILSHDFNKAYLFFGPSGAGKTTISELAKPRKILSDDMNVLHLEKGELLCSAGGVGGLYKPQVPIDKKYKIENIFWLIQDKHSSISSSTKKEQFKYLLATCANLPLGNINKTLEDEILSLSESILHQKAIQKLHFPKEISIWSMIDPN